MDYKGIYDAFHVISYMPSVFPLSEHGHNCRKTRKAQWHRPSVSKSKLKSPFVPARHVSPATAP